MSASRLALPYEIWQMVLFEALKKALDGVGPKSKAQNHELELALLWRSGLRVCTIFKSIIEDLYMKRILSRIDIRIHYRK